MYDPTSDVGYVRLTIGDTIVDPAGQVFTDAEIGAFLKREGGPLSAAARALDIIADSEARLSKAIRTQDLATDGAKVADSMRKHAASLRAQAKAAGEGVDDAEDDWAIATFTKRPTAPELAGFRRFGDGWLN